MTVIERWEVEVCDECGLHVMDSDHATSNHQNTDRTRWVEVVPSGTYQGAVERVAAALRIVEDHRDGRGNCQMGRGFASQVVELLRAARGQ